MKRKYTDLIAPAFVRSPRELSLRERIGTITLDDGTEYALDRAGAELIVGAPGAVEVVVSLETLTEAMAKLLEAQGKQDNANG